MASISSMKIMHGARLRAMSNRSRTRAAPTPTNISTKLEPVTEMNGTWACPLVCTFITAFARMRSIQASNDRQLARPHSRRRKPLCDYRAANRTITVEEFQWKSVP